MSDKKRLFGTFGVRRVANEVLTPEFASKIAAAHGTKVKGTIAIGSDPRTSSEMIKHAVTAIWLLRSESEPHNQPSASCLQ